MEYTILQKQEIEKGYEDGLSEEMINLYKDKKYNYLKMNFIRVAFNEGMAIEEVKQFADPTYSISEMEILKHKIKNGETISIDEKKTKKTTKSMRLTDVLCVVLLLLVICCFIMYCSYQRQKKEVQVSIQSPYVIERLEPFDANDPIQICQLNSTTKLIKPEEFETDQVGSNIIVYELKDLFKTISIPIRVDVIDVIPPEIKFKKNEAVLMKGTPFNMYTYLDTVIDDVDGSITERVTCDVEQIDPTHAKAIFCVEDEAGNQTVEELLIVYKDIEEIVEGYDNIQFSEE